MLFFQHLISMIALQQCQTLFKNHYDDFDDDTLQVCPIQDDEDGHLSYKLGDIIENETQRCKLQYSWNQRCLVVEKWPKILVKKVIYCPLFSKVSIEKPLKKIKNCFLPWDFGNTERKNTLFMCSLCSLLLDGPVPGWLDRVLQKDAHQSLQKNKAHRGGER